VVLNRPQSSFDYLASILQSALNWCCQLEKRGTVWAWTGVSRHVLRQYFPCLGLSREDYSLGLSLSWFHPCAWEVVECADKKSVRWMKCLWSAQFWTTKEPVVKAVRAISVMPSVTEPIKSSLEIHKLNCWTEYPPSFFNLMISVGAWVWQWVHWHCWLGDGKGIRPGFNNFYCMPL